jgi:mannose-6-phosphate isomerase-like protein (cupin superfamily)
VRSWLLQAQKAEERAMARRNLIDTFETAKSAGPYDEYPVLLESVDPQLHLSRNDRPQPFHMTCEKDSILIQMSGTARIEMLDTSVLYFETTPGDYTYIPGGIPHRIFPAEPSVMYRYKAREAGLEAATFFCESCGEVLLRETWDTAEELPQSAYLRIVERFNSEAALRQCDCGHQHPAVDLTGYRWKEIAEELLETEVEEAW